MQPWRDVVLNSRGEPIEGLSVQVLTDPGGIAATIYSDDGVTLADNPLTTDSDGAYFFFATDGRYQVIISGTNITTKTIDGIVLDDSASTLTIPLPVNIGGTGAITPGGARENLGSTAVGDAVFVAATAAIARTALGATTVGDAVFVAADAAAARSAIGAGDFLADGSVPMTGDLQLGAGKGIIFEGATDDAFETTLVVTDPLADRTVTIGPGTGIIPVPTDAGTAAQVLTSAGAGAQPTWETPSAGGSGGGFLAPTAAVAANALTVTLPSGSVLNFNDGTSITTSGAITVTASSGSTLGTESGIASTLWVVAMKNGGTPELAIRNNWNPTAKSIAWPGLSGTIGTTAEGGAGAADSAQVWYSTTARATQPFCVVGYVSSSQATAGTWASAPTIIQGFGPGVKLPNDVVQSTSIETTDATFNTASASLTDITGMSVAITPTNAANAVKMSVSMASGGNATYSHNLLALRGSTAILRGDAASARTRATAGMMACSTAEMRETAFQVVDSPNSNASTTYKMQVAVESGSTFYLNRNYLDTDTANYPRGASTIRLEEIVK